MNPIVTLADTGGDMARYHNSIAACTFVVIFGVALAIILILSAWWNNRDNC